MRKWVKRIILLVIVISISTFLFSFGHYAGKTQTEDDIIPYVHQLQKELNECSNYVIYNKPFIDYCMVQIGIHQMSVRSCLSELRYYRAIVNYDDFEL